MIGVSGPRVRLADDAGAVLTVTVAELLTDPGSTSSTRRRRRCRARRSALEGLPAAAVEEASWWEAHIVEVVYGLPPDAPPGRDRGRSTTRSAPA